METGLIGGAVALVILLLTIWVIRTVCDVVIFLAFLAAVAIPFLIGISGEMAQEEVILLAVALGILMPVITLPLWPISKIMRSEVKNIEGNKMDDDNMLLDVDTLEDYQRLTEGNVKKYNKALKQLESLKEKGLITEDDYEIKKKEITDRD